MNWPKLDPRTEFWLCENCWNRGKWSHHCTGGLCECPKCQGMQPAPRVKFTGAGQEKLPDPGGEWIGPKADEMRRQAAALEQSEHKDTN